MTKLSKQLTIAVACLFVGSCVMLASITNTKLPAQPKTEKQIQAEAKMAEREAVVRAERAKADEKYAGAGEKVGSYTLKDYIRRQLRDPDSLEVESIQTNRIPDRGGLWMYTIDYRARNGFGGMNRDGMVILARGDTIYFHGTPAEFLSNAKTIFGSIPDLTRRQK